jgi:nucleoside-diphosphate-sugar epimerase
MKICVIGTGGFLAKAIIEKFSKEAIDLFFIGRTKPPGFADNQFCLVDLLSDELPLDKIEACEVVIYTAGLGVQSGEKVNNEDIYAVNTFIPIKLCENLNKVNFTGLFISFGSYFEIGSVESLHYFTEEDILHSRASLPNAYCFSKRMLTQYYCFGKFIFRNYHFILPSIYGNGENHNRLIPYTIDGFKFNRPLNFTAGTQVRQYLLVDDAARLILNCILQRIPSGVYNFPSAESVTIKELVKQIGKGFGVEVPDESFEKIQRADSSMQVLQTNAGKLLKKISIVPLTTIEQYVKSIKKLT